MPDFSHLQQFDVTEKASRKFTFHEIKVNGETPYVMVYPAVRRNSGYWNAMMSGASGIVSDDAQDDGKRFGEVEKDAYAHHVIHGWGNVCDSDGADVKFTPASCRAFLDSLPEWLYRRLRTFCSTEENFAKDAINVGEVSKN